MRYLIFVLLLSTAAFSQVPPITPGVSQELAKWRAAHYSDVRYKLNLALEKMSPVLKGTMEIRVGVRTLLSASAQGADTPPIILDWRKIAGHEAKSVISNVAINGKAVSPPSGDADKSVGAPFEETNEHLIFRDGVKLGENVITLDFTSPILTSGSAITRYIDKEDGSEYIYSLFVPSDASTAFPVFDQPDLKARFSLSIKSEFVQGRGQRLISNATYLKGGIYADSLHQIEERKTWQFAEFAETKPISTYVFAFAAGPFEKLTDAGAEGRNLSGSEGVQRDVPLNSNTLPTGRVSASVKDGSMYVRKSQAAKFQPHAAEVFRLNREAVKYFEEYFDYKFPFPKYDLVLIPEFPFGGMEHAGATFLRESAIIFPQEPTKSDHISRAVLMFHEAAHQWFGDTVTMKWFDDLWLKEGFANFMAYKALEKIKLGGGNPTGREGVSANLEQVDAWKVFYERIKQPAYATDSTKGTTPIYQEIPNLSAAKSAYGNIVYNKAPAFLKQAEFYLGPDKFQTAVRKFLKGHEFANAGWEDLVKEFEAASERNLKDWANVWVKKRGVPIIRWQNDTITQTDALKEGSYWTEKLQLYVVATNPNISVDGTFILDSQKEAVPSPLRGEFKFPNYEDYGYGIFLLDDKSRDYVLKNIQNEKDAFLRSMMYGALWDSVREGELDPRTYVDVAIRNLPTEQDETIAQMMTSRTATALNYYVGTEGGNLSGSEGVQRDVPLNSNTLPTGRVSASNAAFENVLIDRFKNAPTLGQRITFFRAFLNIAASGNARDVLKSLLTAETQSRGDAKGGNPSGNEGAPRGISSTKSTLPTGRVSASGAGLPLRAKDKFDIITRLAVLNDPDAARLLAELEKTETTDDAKRYAYAARAAFPTKENREKFWNDFVANKDISESWIEAAVGPFNSVRNSELSLPYLERALKELPNLKRSRKIFFVNNWLGAFIGGQRSEGALAIVNKFLTDNPNLDRDLRLKILENVDIIERAVKIRAKYGSN